MGTTGQNLGDYTITYTNGLPQQFAAFHLAAAETAPTDEEIWDIAERLKASDYVTSRFTGGTIAVDTIALVGTSLIPAL
jgi:hypothetical protein